MAKWRCRYDTRNSGPPRSTSIQPMVAKRPLLLQRFSITSLAQFIRHYNWIYVCINKIKRRGPDSFLALKLSTRQRVQDGRGSAGCASAKIATGASAVTFRGRLL